MPVFLGLAALFASLDWIAVASNRRRLEAFAKPGTIIALLGWYLTAGGFSASAGGWVFAIGLILSLVGDVLLLPQINRVLPGLVAFFFALLAYLFAINQSGIIWNAGSVAILAGVLLLSAGIALRLARSLRQAGRRRLVGPVAIYAFVLGLMTWSALSRLTSETPPGSPGKLLALGGALFYVSDGLTAWSRFVAPFPGGRFASHVTYHLAQALLTAGVSLSI